MKNTTNKAAVQIIEKPQEEKKESLSVESFISQAIQTNVPIETLERLLAMRDKVKAEQAKEAFINAMAKFQSECPIIEKKKIVLAKDKVTIRYKYAPLESIVSQVKDALANNGLSYRFDEIKDNTFTAAVCTITHIMGHSEQSTFKVEIGNEDYMTDTQKYGARMTFAKRYAFCNALGILTGDEDNDANEEEDQAKTPIKPQTPKVDLSQSKARLQACKDIEELKVIWSALPLVAKNALKEVKEEMKKKYETA